MRWWQVITRYENITFPALDWQGKTDRFTPRETWDLPIGSGESITLRILDPAPWKLTMSGPFLRVSPWIQRQLFCQGVYFAWHELLLAQGQGRQRISGKHSRQERRAQCASPVAADHSLAQVRCKGHGIKCGILSATANPLIGIQVEELCRTPAASGRCSRQWRRPQDVFSSCLGQ